jgi:hypothetical protein
VGLPCTPHWWCIQSPEAAVTIAELFDYLSKGGLLAGMLLFITGLWRRWLVWRGEYDQLQADRDFWRTMALNATGLAELTAKRKAGDE